MFPFLLSKYLGVELLSHIVSVYLPLYETARLFSKVAVPFYTATSNESSTSSPTPLATLVGVCWYVTVI